MSVFVADMPMCRITSIGDRVRAGRNRWCTGRQAVVEVASAPIMLLNEAVSVVVAELDFPEQDYFHRAPRGTLFAT